MVARNRLQYAYRRREWHSFGQGEGPHDILGLRYLKLVNHAGLNVAVDEFLSLYSCSH